MHHCNNAGFPNKSNLLICYTDEGKLCALLYISPSIYPSISMFSSSSRRAHDVWRDCKYYCIRCNRWHVTPESESELHAVILRLLSVCRSLVLATTEKQNRLVIGTYKSGGVMGSGHSSTLLLTAENSERVGRKITEVANFDFRKETLHSSQM